MLGYFPVHLNMQEASIIAAIRDEGSFTITRNYEYAYEAEIYVKRFESIGDYVIFDSKDHGMYVVTSEDSKIRIQAGYKKVTPPASKE